MVVEEVSIFGEGLVVGGTLQAVVIGMSDISL